MTAEDQSKVQDDVPQKCLLRLTEALQGSYRPIICYNSCFQLSDLEYHMDLAFLIMFGDLAGFKYLTY